MPLANRGRGGAGNSTIRLGNAAADSARTRQLRLPRDILGCVFFFLDQGRKIHPTVTIAHQPEDKLKAKFQGITYLIPCTDRAAERTRHTRPLWATDGTIHPVASDPLRSTRNPHAQHVRHTSCPHTHADCRPGTDGATGSHTLASDTTGSHSRVTGSPSWRASSAAASGPGCHSATYIPRSAGAQGDCDLRLRPR